MYSSKSFSKICLFIVGSVFAFIFSKESFTNREKENCTAAFDQFGYYSYLPATFIYDDLAFQKPWKNQLQNRYCNQEVVYQFVDIEGGKKVNMYQMGLAYVHLPAFLIANSVAKPLGYEQNGMSYPYRVAIKLTALLFIFLGLIYCRKTLLLFFSDWIAGLILILIYGASNVFVTFYYGDLMPHLYLFTLNTIFIYTLLKFLENGQRKYWIISALILGLTVVIRPTQAIWGIIPLVLFMSKYKFRWRTIQLLMIYPITILLLNFPQMLYWKFYGGNWIIMNLHSETLSLLRPYTLEFLFSYKKGWLLYSPLFLFSFIGIWYAWKSNKPLTFALVFFAALNIYILSSWDCWWYAASFSSRVMVDSYIVFALLLGFFIKHLTKTRLYQTLGLGIGACILFLNAFQSLQYFRGIIDNGRMTKDHYWYVFGKLHFKKYDTSLLEIDREDIDWDKKVFLPNTNAAKLGYKMRTKRLFQLPSKVKFDQSTQFVDIWQCKILDLITTDEGKIRVQLKMDRKIDVGKVFLVFKIIDREKIYFERYMDLNSEIFEFNLPIIRHEQDHMSVFIFNPNRKYGSIDSIQISTVFIERE